MIPVAALKALPWRAIGLAASVAVLALLWFRGSYYRDDAANEQRIASVAIETNKANAAIDAEKAAQLKRADSIDTVIISAEERHQTLVSAQKRKIANAAPSDDGPIAPVLRDALDWLHPSRSGDAGSAGAGQVRPDAPSDMQRTPGRRAAERDTKGRSS